MTHAGREIQIMRRKSHGSVAVGVAITILLRINLLLRINQVIVSSR